MPIITIRWANSQHNTPPPVSCPPAHDLPPPCYPESCQLYLPKPTCADSQDGGAWGGMQAGLTAWAGVTEWYATLISLMPCGLVVRGTAYWIAKGPFSMWTGWLRLQSKVVRGLNQGANVLPVVSALPVHPQGLVDLLRHLYPAVNFAPQLQDKFYNMNINCRTYMLN